MLPHVKSMVIDEEKKYVLTNYEQVRKGGKAADTDHNTEFMDVDLKIIAAKPVRREIWNFKEKESQETFKRATSETNNFTNCFKNDLNLETQVEKWKKLLLSTCNKSFKKVRVTRSKPTKNLPPKVSELIDIRNKISNNVGNKEELIILNEKISGS